MSEQLRLILESKRAMRTRLAALPFAEKLRSRALAIAASRK